MGASMTGGELVADVLVRQGVRFLFTLCGGHISPILVSAKARGIRVVDTRHEATAVFAADAVARLTGVPGFAAVTAGPGVTNTITALKNAQMAQSPLVLVGGATATLLRGRGALQDIDQMALVRPHVKRASRVARVRDLVPALEEAFRLSREGVPGPVFLECPVDLLYPESLVREWYAAKAGKAARTLGERALAWYVGRHLGRLFGDVRPVPAGGPAPVPAPEPDEARVRRAAVLLSRASRPVLLVGSQALLSATEADALARGRPRPRRAGLPLGHGARPAGCPTTPCRCATGGRRRCARPTSSSWPGCPATSASTTAITSAGAPCSSPRTAAATRSRRTGGPPSRRSARRSSSSAASRARRRAPGRSGRPGGRPCAPGTPSRDAEIAAQAGIDAPGGLNPLRVCRALEATLADDSVIVADGGDFVSTASYVLRPRRPLSWLDPGPFGTLGVGAGFALGAKLVRPTADVWIVYGDGSVGYSLAEADTFARHGLGVVALVGNDAGWTQIAREQVEVLKDDVGTVLAATDYERAAEGLGAHGLRLDDPGRVDAVLQEARDLARGGRPVYVNARIGRTDFRKGSISM